jgi:NDP-sugar pyrophosphorylase family protein
VSVRTAMILAAGFGTRLRPLTGTVPKALVPVAGRPMIEYAIVALARAGVERIVVNLHHLGERIPAALGDGRRFGVSIAYSSEETILETGGGIARARPLLGDGDFFVANCDALCDADLGALARRHVESGALATLLLREDPDAARYGLVETDDAGRIARFLGRLAPGIDASALRPRMFCGLHVLSPRVFGWMPAAGAFSITRDVYAPAVEGGAALVGLDHPGYWRDLGSAASIALAERDLADGRFVPSHPSC